MLLCCQFFIYLFFRSPKILIRILFFVYKFFKFFISFSTRQVPIKFVTILNHWQIILGEQNSSLHYQVKSNNHIPRGDDKKKWRIKNIFNCLAKHTCVRGMNDPMKEHIPLQREIITKFKESNSIFVLCFEWTG